MAMIVTTAPMNKLFSSDRPNVLFVVSNAYEKFENVLCTNHGVVSNV